MRLLVIHDELYPNTSANARIVYRIIDELLKHYDVEVTIMGCAQTEEQYAPLYHECKIVHTPWKKTCRYFRFLDKLGRLKCLRYILMPRSIVYRVLHPRWTPRDVEMMRWIYHHRRQFDVILACAMPFYSVDIATQISRYIPVVNYYMEPYWGNLPSFYSNEHIISRLWDGSALRVIVPEHIKKIYMEYADKDIIDKLVVAEFPNVVKHDEHKIDDILFSAEKINLAFVGKFYPEVREPQYLFDIMQLIHTKGIGLTIAGGFNGTFSKSYVEKYFSNNISYIKYVGMLPPHEADDLLMNSNVLLHIGNTKPELLPSKILNYISTGKSIINLYQHEHCPTLEILANYPLKINIRVGTPLTPELIQSIVDFCCENCDKQLPFIEIEKLYKKYTPKVVGHIFYRTLKDVITGKKCHESF